MLYEIIGSSLITLPGLISWFAFTLHHLVRNLSIQVTIKGINCCLNSHDLLCFFVRNIEPEVLLHRHHQLHRVKGIKSQLFKSCWSAQFRLIAFGSSLENLINFSLDLFEQCYLSWVWGRSEIVSDCGDTDFERVVIGGFFEDGSGPEYGSRNHSLCLLSQSKLISFFG